ncbi:hypothetical protein L596_027278 [Steinernema carpocapsae]|uniref:Nematode cuticle collagen N-terminal domain-containing protein n=1 Tax=Steinernema carpocapsae TaxID=34508 RepID=A0A4U5M3V0_STECR|nr:hypothetical protein L596_027278 [Steinernema carpocapsae]
MSIKFLVGAATAGSGIVIVASLVMVGVLFQDINSLQNDILGEVDEFKVGLVALKVELMNGLFQLIANDAWQGMMAFQSPGSSQPSVVSITALFGRNKRGAECNCGEQAKNCPAGAAGPPGAPGNNGDDGLPGAPGANGEWRRSSTAPRRTDA